MASDASAAAAVKQVIDGFGRIDVLVNNAGIGSDVYAQQRHVFEEYVAGAVEDGDDPAVVAKEIVAAATDTKPKLRYAAGARTGRVHTMRRLVPARMFDQQLRKLNRLPA